LAFVVKSWVFEGYYHHRRPWFLKGKERKDKQNKAKQTKGKE